MKVNLCDWDDTLVKSNDLIFDAYKNSYAQYGIDYEVSHWYNLVGKNNRETAKHFGVDESLINTIMKNIFSIYPKNYMRDIKVNTTLVKKILVEKNTGESINFVCSNSPWKSIESIIKAKSIFANLFEEIVTTDSPHINETLKKKPSPDIYVHPILHFVDNKKIDSITIYDDSELGLEAGRIASKVFNKLGIKTNVIKITI